MNSVKKNKIKRGEIRFNYRHGHLGHIKKVYKEQGIRKASSVFISSKEFDDGKPNIPMKKNIKYNNVDKSYFIKRIRTYPLKTYSKEKIKDKLSLFDKRISNQIYKQYLKNKKRR